MRKKSGIVLMLFIALLVGYGQVQAMSSTPQYKIKQYPGAENVEIIKDFAVPQLDTTKDIWVYLPPGYRKTEKNYPVLYMQEGEKLFDNQAQRGSWRIDETLNKLVSEGKTAGAIVVGITSSNPKQEFIPWKCWPLKEEVDKFKGEKYGKFIVNTLKPYIDRHYQTLPGRENTAIGGGEFGGMFALYAGVRYQYVFSKVAAFSPAVWVQLHSGRPLYEKFKVGKTKQMKFYLDVGKKATNDPAWNYVFTSYIKRYYKLLQDGGFKKENVKLVIDEDGQQTEDYWAERFPAAFLWLFNN